MPLCTIRPPCSPAPGPMSTTQSAVRMVSSSCSTTISVLPSSRNRTRVSISRWLSRWCRPMLGSSSTYRTPTRPRPDLRGQPDALCLAAGQRARGPVERQVVEPDVDQEPEPGVDVVGGNDDVGVADQADASAQAEALHRGHHRHLAVVHGGEGGVAAAIGSDQGVVAFGGLHLLDVDAGAEPPPLRRQHDHPGGPVLAQRPHGVGQGEPGGDVESVDRRDVDDHLGHPAAHLLGDAHAALSDWPSERQETSGRSLSCETPGQGDTTMVFSSAGVLSE